MRTSNELSTLYKSIDQKSISDSAKETLKKIRLANKNWKGKDEDAQELFIEFFNKLKSSKPVAVKTTKEYKDALKKAQSERGKTMGNAKKKATEPKGQGTEEDANRPAKPFGWRMRGKHNYRKPTRDDISKGKAYYEGRVNRADAKRKKYPMLERGGKLEEKLFSIYPHSVGKAKYVIDVYDGNSTNKDGSPFIGIRTAQNKVKLNSTINSLKEDGFKEVDNVFNYLRKYEDGGYMAKGGRIDEMAIYVSARDIEEIKLTINGDKKTLKGSDLMDGVYVKKSSLGGEDEGNFRFKKGDIVYAFQSASDKFGKLRKNIDKQFVVGNEKDKNLQKFAKVEIVEPLNNEKNWETYKVKLIDGDYDNYPDKKIAKGEIFVTPQGQLSKSNKRPISSGYVDMIIEAEKEDGYMAQGGEVFYTEKHKND